MAKGSIKRRGTSWTVVVDVGQVQGKRKQLTKGGFRTRRAAQVWLTEQTGRLDRGEYIAPAKVTYGEFLATWLPGIRGTVRPSTYESYERMIRVHALPRLGGVPLQRLGPEDLNRAYADLGGHLSPRSVQYVHVIVHRSLRDAVRWGKVARNAADMADPPKVTGRREMTTWTAEELGQFLDSIKDDPLRVPVLVLATTGMRRGEGLGLRWTDVDLDRGQVTVRQTLSAPRNPETGRHVLMFLPPKTDAGKRVIALDGRTVAALKAHRKAQAGIRLLAGPGYQDQGLVFTEPNGNPIHPDHFRQRFGARVRRAGLPMIRVHDLRHTFATLAFQAGVPAKVVQGRLGHSKVSITLDTYTHAIPAMDQDAAETVAARIFGSA
jgi:integrase